MNDSLDKVIVALDYEDPQKAYRLVEELGAAISWYKVGPVLFTRSGIDVVHFLHKQNKKIFLDLKLHDTPTVVSQTIRQYGDLGVQLATVHCAGGKRMLEAASRGCRGSQIKLLGVTLLTSQDSSDSRAWGGTHTESGVVMGMLDLAFETRLAGVICSPHEIADVKAKSLPGFLCVSAGIRLPGQEVFQDDQIRVASPADALAWGADYLVIGRPITQAREPREVLENLFAKP